jgi:DNA-binding NarL/FixJ family response regulator
MIKILIVDDHPVVRQGLKQTLADELDVSVFGEARNTQELLEKVRKQDWDVVVMDIAMPGRSGLDVLKELKQISPKLPVLVLSMHAEDQYGIRVLKAGAAGYLTKESAPDELVKAIRKVLSGGIYISDTLAERLAFNVQADTLDLPHENLSNREHEIMCMIASGRTIKEIAYALSISAKTVSTYRTRVMQKMGMKSNAELTHYVIKNRLVTD